MKIQQRQQSGCSVTSRNPPGQASPEGCLLAKSFPVLASLVRFSVMTKGDIQGGRDGDRNQKASVMSREVWVNGDRGLEAGQDPKSSQTQTMVGNKKGKFLSRGHSVCRGSEARNRGPFRTEGNATWEQRAQPGLLDPGSTPEPLGSRSHTTLTCQGQVALVGEPGAGGPAAPGADLAEAEGAGA